MMRKNIDLSIVIVKYKSEDYLEDCFKSIKTNDNWEIIIVDNDINNVGYGSGLNLGAAKARGEYLLFLNPDVLILNRAIEKMINFMKENLDVGVVGPKMYKNKKKDLQLSFCRFPSPLISVFVYSPLKSSFLGKLLWRWFTYADKLNTNVPIQVDEVSGAAMVVRKSVFNEIGGFDENIFLYFEENDLCKRIIKTGYKVVFFPDSEIIHYGGKSTPEDKKANKFFRNSRKYFFKKYYGKLEGEILESIIRLMEYFVLPLCKGKKQTRL